MTLLSVRKCFMFTKQWSIAWMWIRVIVTDLYCVYIDCIVCTLTILCVHWLYCVYIDCRYFIVFFILQNRKNKPHKFTLNIFIWFYYIININKRQRTKLFQKNFLWFCTELFSIDQSWLDVVEIVIDITYLL